jgi:simple sugar transport system permease protein
MNAISARARRDLLEVVVAAAAVVLSLLVGAAIIGLAGRDPIQVFGVLFEEALGQPLGLGQVLFKTTTLTFTGLAAAFAFRTGLFNIGGEGQLYLGAFVAAVVGAALPASTPSFLAIPLLLLTAFAGGGAAALIPGLLKAKRGTHEVISTMMASFILLAVVNYLLNLVRVPETVRTEAIVASGRLPLFSALAPSMRGSDGNASLLIAVLTVALVWYAIERTRLGYELRAVGLGAKAAEYGGVDIEARVLLSLVVSGGLAGLGGINFVLGSPGYFEQNFAPYQGYLGIAVALLARNRPIGIVPAAFLFALLSEGGQAIQEFVPKEIGEILQAVVIMFVVVGSKLLERWITRAEAGAHD